MTAETTDRYSRLATMLRGERCVILDGAVATELQALGARDFRLSDSDHWGFEAVEQLPNAVADVHRRYAEAGCDVITTNTYGILDATGRRVSALRLGARPLHWMDLARDAVRIARRAVEETGRGGECAVAFSIGGDVVTDEHLKTVQLLLRCLRDDPPDLVIFETLSMMKEHRTKEAIRLLIDAGLPVWASFRRCRDGVCSIHGQLWGAPEGDYFGRLAAELEDLGVGALLVNCLPVQRVSGTLPWLADFTDLPLGAYPNLGRYVDPEWRFDERIGPDEYADMALIWRAEGARILGGCCGVGPAHVEAMAQAVEGTRPLAPIGTADAPPARTATTAFAPPTHAGNWQDRDGRDLYPLPLPELHCDAQVAAPAQGSHLLWKHVFRERIGRGLDCLDVGCGAGLVAIQLALNGAARVTAIDDDRAAVANTLTNAFRNQVDDVVRGEVVDLDALGGHPPCAVVVASPAQMPADPGDAPSGHQSIDYWGRDHLDRLIAALPHLLAENGRAYVTQLSLSSRTETERRLHAAGLTATVVDFTVCRMPPAFLDNLTQIERIEAASDAYHFAWHDAHALVIYLLEIRATEAARAP